MLSGGGEGGGGGLRSEVFRTIVAKNSGENYFFIAANRSSLGRYVFGSEISYNKAPPRLPGLGC